MSDRPPKTPRAAHRRASSNLAPVKTPATLAEVARLAGFSTATVSRAFNFPDKVKPEVRQRILDVAKLVRYRPNRLVSGVLHGRVPILGVVLNVLNTAFMPELLGGVFEACETAGYSCMVYDSAARQEREVNALKLCIQHRLSGIILFPVDNESLERSQILTEIGELDVPVVTLMSPIAALPEAPLVGNDDYKGALAAVGHLIELGHRRILHLSGSDAHYRSSDERLRGYRDAYTRAGLAVPRDLVRIAGFGPGMQTWRILEELEFKGKTRPYTAIFAASDYVANRAIQFFQSRGIQVPQQVSIVGFGDLPLCELTWPPLTSVNQDFHRVGVMAAQVCLDRVKRKPTNEASPWLVPVSLIVRESTGPIARIRKRPS
ncbi:MAG TPA: LacI family DNA-binding transcriptional regulator [Candidatus Hydrogenedentes bacterium]|nr:LacI family DNA-binding transcriptional regulator [Candidatus Hydrogenedentota bacterium]HOR27049.1 LacI family DNA-binding transcriptional regulator [Candidatus Sumerlaeota bacterium]HPK02629.1 LacI family DNA-binding transcriptional regulator [Candidatus Sumerlaeota bacterium]